MYLFHFLKYPNYNYSVLYILHMVLIVDGNFYVEINRMSYINSNYTNAFYLYLFFVSLSLSLLLCQVNGGCPPRALHGYPSPPWCRCGPAPTLQLASARPREHQQLFRRGQVGLSGPHGNGRRGGRGGTAA